MAKTTGKKPQTPMERIDNTIDKLKDVDSKFFIRATDVPRDAYALLVFGISRGCTVERITESNFQLNSLDTTGGRFMVAKNASFRRTFTQMVKSLEPSPASRKNFMTSMEKYAEACLSVTDQHKEFNGSLPLEDDRTLNSNEPAENRKPSEATPPSTTPSAPSVLTDRRKVIKSEPFQAKYYQRKDNGVKRDSELINTITYDDGSEAFQCRVCNEYTSDNPKSLPGHIGKHSPQERTNAKGTPVLHLTDKWVPTSTQRSRITRLANEISKAMELGLSTPEEIASAIIEARSKDPNGQGDGDDPEVIDMTPEQQIEAIRRILGDDQEAKAVSDRQEKLISGLQDQVDRTRTEMDLLRKDRDLAKKNLADYQAWMASAPKPS
ncbi:hypothetical protein [Glutamicibacter endophyticus]|uniref:hypothetical protein n=1 Tax=Glutamicibacter endophyticus TaxID=1522174 RepID=UPI003AEFC4BF